MVRTHEIPHAIQAWSLVHGSQVKVSQDERLLAYTLDLDGGQEHYSVYLRDIASGEQPLMYLPLYKPRGHAVLTVRMPDRLTSTLLHEATCAYVEQLLYRQSVSAHWVQDR